MIDEQQIQILNNLSRVRDIITRAAAVGSRNPEDIKLVVVSKKQPVEKLKMAIESGVKIFGENYPEEAAGKILDINQSHSVEWHMIGHLQSRKIPIVIAYFDYFHSLDNLSLAEKLNRQLLEKNKKLKVLIELNISGELSKQGFPANNESEWSLLSEEMQKIMALPTLDVTGLMTMPPIFADAEQSRPYFKKLFKIRSYLNHHLRTDRLIELSMGTSVDYPVAVEEGATFVRIGQAILGERPYNGVNKL